MVGHRSRRPFSLVFRISPRHPSAHRIDALLESSRESSRQFRERLSPWVSVILTSLSKVVAPGLRVGFLVAPAGDIFDRWVRAARALTHSPSGINFAIATEWIRSGRAEKLAIAACAEAHARTSMGLAALGDAVARPRPAASLHLWLPMLTEIAETHGCPRHGVGTPPRASESLPYVEGRDRRGRVAAIPRGCREPGNARLGPLHS